MFKLNLFRNPEVTRENDREAGYKDAAAILLRTGDQQRVEDMTGGPYLNFHGFTSPYAAGARDASHDYHKRLSDVVDKARQALAELELS